MSYWVKFEGVPIDNQVREMPEILPHYRIVEEKKIVAVPYNYKPVRMLVVHHIYNKSQREQGGMFIYWYAGSRDDVN